MSLVLTQSVAIVGAGMSGLCAAMSLRRNGCRDVTIYEKAEDLGGTWRDNRYPGLYCDAPARLYCYSFAPNSTSPTLFADSANIHGYLQRTADEQGVSDLIRYGSEVTEATWGADGWTLTLGDGTRHRHDAVVFATGYLHHPSMPTIDGMADFAGPSFHSARWPRDLDVAGLRVGVIGAGSTGVQIVTALSEKCPKVVHFQRTPQWVVPFPNLRYSRLSMALHKRFTSLARDRHRRYAKMFVPIGNAPLYDGVARKVMKRIALHGLNSVRDRSLRKRITPDYEILCKRPILSGGYYTAIQRDNVHLVTEGIDRIESAGVKTRDGELHEFDVLVYATGFDAHAYMRPTKVFGVNGLALDEVWGDGAQAHRSVMVPGFPNMFLMTGPYSPLANSTIVEVAEAQTRFLTRALQKVELAGARALHPRAEAAEAFYARVRPALDSTVWATGGCDSWYQDGAGRIELWPFAIDRHTEELRKPDLDEFHLIRHIEGDNHALPLGEDDAHDHPPHGKTAARRPNAGKTPAVRH